MTRLKNQNILVTGASSGFGEAIALRLAQEGANLAIGARREDKLKSLARKIHSETESNVWVGELDVMSTESAKSFVENAEKELGSIDVLINNAGLALGVDAVSEAKEEDWERMFQTNFLGIFRMTQAILRGMIQRQRGHIVNIGSIAGWYAYEGGGGYCGSKFAVAAFTRSLRQEVCGDGIRVSSVDPGMAETEFSLVRFKGDQEKAKNVYRGMKPLSAMDVAEIVAFVVKQPPHVNIDDILVTPARQGGVHKVVRDAE